MTDTQTKDTDTFVQYRPPLPLLSRYPYCFSYKIKHTLLGLWVIDSQTTDRAKEIWGTWFPEK